MDGCIEMTRRSGVEPTNGGTRTTLMNPSPLAVRGFVATLDDLDGH